MQLFPGRRRALFGCNGRRRRRWLVDAETACKRALIGTLRTDVQETGRGAAESRMWRPRQARLAAELHGQRASVPPDTRLREHALRHPTYAAPIGQFSA